MCPTTGLPKKDVLNANAHASSRLCTAFATTLPTQEFELPAQGPLWHVLGGGIIGVLLAYLIALIVSRLPTHPIRSFLAALVVVPLTIFLARLSTGLLPLPITVDLRDSVGGLVLGVFAVWLVPKVVARLLPNSAAPDNAENAEAGG